MQKLALVLLLLCCLTSCKSTKHVTDTSKKTEQNLAKKGDAHSLASTIVENAKTFSGVKYKYGGITNKGMDCSGLVYISFKKENILLPRVSRDMAEGGMPIKLSDVQKGDLLFFQTKKIKR
jgi:cell wall-associated NlpC family hydrolase